jgi:serine/threonine protein kinase
MAVTLNSSPTRAKKRGRIHHVKPEMSFCHNKRHGLTYFLFLGAASVCTLASCFFLLTTANVMDRDLERHPVETTVRVQKNASVVAMNRRHSPANLHLWNNAPPVTIEYLPVRSFPRQMSLPLPRSLQHHPIRKAIDKRPKQEESFLDEYNPRDANHDHKNLAKFLVHQFEDEYQNHCVYMKDWQNTSYPTCNSVHELGMEAIDLKNLGKGGWRRTWSHQQAPDAVLKLLHLEDEEEFDPRAFEVHRVDAVISQRLTSSPHVIDIYGYCGVSALYEKGMYGLDERYENIDLHAKYQLALQVVKGMVDIHGIDYPSGTNATIVHRDLKPSNLMMFKNQKVKFGDFNDSHLRQWNKTSGEPCPFYNRGYPMHWGLGYKPAEHAAQGYPRLDEKMDIYGLGGLLFFFLAEHNPFHELNDEGRKIAIGSGVMPQLPAMYNISEKPEISPEVKIIVHAVERTMVLDPKARPTAQEVLDMVEPILSAAAIKSR